MKPVQPSNVKSECPKKVVKNPYPPTYCDRRPSWDNSLYRPKKKLRLKQLSSPTVELEEFAKEEQDGEDWINSIGRECVDYGGGQTSGQTAQQCGPGAGAGQPTCTQDCKDIGCYTIQNNGGRASHRRYRHRYICGQDPCAHPRYPQCTPNRCFPVQCYRKGPDCPMECCLQVPFVLPSRKVFCHQIASDDVDNSNVACVPCCYNNPPRVNDYEFTYELN